MFRLTQTLAGARRRWSRGFTVIETTIALGVALISIMGAYGLTLAVERHYRGSIAAADMYRQSRIAIERMFRDISETSNKTITIIDNAISFASARDEDGVFQEESYGVLSYGRPVWQKAVIYYVLDGKLYRKEVPKTNWSSNYNPDRAIDTDGEVIATNVVSMYFSPTEVTGQDHILEVYLEFQKSEEETEAGPAPRISLSTGIPIMNRER